MHKVGQITLAMHTNELLDCLNGYCTFLVVLTYSVGITSYPHSPRALALGGICMHKYGLFEFKIMPFGLTNAPSTFQRFMHNALLGLSDFVNVYLDDILVFRKSIPEHSGVCSVLCC